MAYQRDLLELIALTHEQSGAPDLKTLDFMQIRRFVAHLHGSGLNPRSIARKLSSWRSYFNWLSEHQQLATNPVDGVKPPKRGKPLPKALSADEAVHVVSTERPDRDADSPAQRCNLAMFELLYSSGLRVSELTSLDVRYIKTDGYESAGWIDFESAEVKVTGKGNRQRTVPVGRPALSAIRAWLAARGSVVKTDPYPLFLNARGKRVSSSVVQHRLKDHAQALGIPSNVHPHVLRHSFASHVLQSSGDLRAVQEMLGHQSIAATQVYTALDFQRLAQVYDAAHPRAKKK